MSKKHINIEAQRLYNRQHYAVVAAYGKASDHICDGCENNAACWAQIHKTGGNSVDDFKPMCWPCHHKYDDRWNEDERRRLGETLKKLWRNDPTLRENALGNTNASGKRSAQSVANIKEGAKAIIGNKHATGKRTPEQCENIRRGRWGGES